MSDLRFVRLIAIVVVVLGTTAVFLTTHHKPTRAQQNSQLYLPIIQQPPATQLTGSPNAPAASAIPATPFTPRAQDYSTNHPSLTGIYLSFNTLFLAFELDTTVAEANNILHQLDAQIVGGIPGITQQAEGILALRLPSQGHGEMIAHLNALEANPRIKYVVQDSLLETTVIPQPSSGVTWTSACNGTFASGAWAWEATPTGGNWGLELMRTPQMWNLNAGIAKAGTSTATGILDVGFADSHPDLVYESNLTPGRQANHGTHVAGTIGATFDNGVGLDGLNPFARLTVRTRDALPSASDVFVQRASWGESHIFSFSDLMNRRPNLRVVNVSLGYNWGRGGVDADSSLAAQRVADRQGALFGLSQIIRQLSGRDLPVIVAAAGNDSNFGFGTQDARHASPLASAALNHGIANIIVVESVANSVSSTGGATRSSFSNINGHIAAPGSDILSSYRPATYETCSGTSMAAPHVTGLISYLYSLDPTLPQPTVTTNPLLTLLQANDVAVAGGAQNRIDGYASALDIDRLRGDDFVRRMLLDIDDGTLDGNQRLQGGTDYTVEDTDGDGGLGDGRIDMADFRRWRDWLLQVENNAALSLDGSATHPKKDVNGNGQVESPTAENLYARGDFNGDGRLSRSATNFVPGRTTGTWTDLEVLQTLFSDPHYTAADLPGLIDSADLEVWPLNCLATPGAVSVRSTLSEFGGATVETRNHDMTNPRHIYTAATTAVGYTARVEALDGGGIVLATAEAHFPFVLGSDATWNPTCVPDSDTPPTADITNPANDTGTSDVDFVFDGFDTAQGMWYKDVVLVGNGSDAEDGALSGAALVWTTDRTDLQAATLGTGNSITARIFSDDCFGSWHEITLTVTDSDGNVATAVRRIFIWTVC